MYFTFTVEGYPALKFKELRFLKNIKMIDYWKGYFISFEQYRNYATFPKTTYTQDMSSLTTLDICSQNSSGHKGQKFGMNTYIPRDYNLTEVIQYRVDQDENALLLCQFDVLYIYIYSYTHTHTHTAQ
jgi:hypothetical protein